MVKKKKIMNVQVKCPYCGKINTMPETASVYVTCSQCGKDWYTEGIEIIYKAGSQVYRNLDKQRKKEIEADKEKD